MNSNEIAYRMYVNKRKALMVDGIEIHANVCQFEELAEAQKRRQWHQRAAKTESISQILFRIGNIAENEFRTAIERARLLTV